MFPLGLNGGQSISAFGFVVCLGIGTAGAAFVLAFIGCR